jgi:glycosyltransferase involved in cell wall biosynthesis
LHPLHKRRPRVLFLQITEAGGYPPIIHASHLMGSAGWDVAILNAPIADHRLEMPRHPQIRIVNIPQRSSHRVKTSDYVRYMLGAGRLALTFRPDVVYASDPFAAGPALAAVKIGNAALAYHEHDTPNAGALNPRIAKLRGKAARAAKFVIFPNENRAKTAQNELGFRDEQLRIVWNVPRRTELPARDPSPDAPIVLHYHGNISPQLLPENVVEALVRSPHDYRLRIMGYESPGARGYAARLVELGKRRGAGIVEYVGQVSRDRLLAEAAKASIGIALMPQRTSDINLTHLLGASNKTFDYMAAGLPLLVSNLPDWKRIFVDAGYGRCCDLADEQSLMQQLDWFAMHNDERRAMGERGRAKIASEWNYERAFQPILTALHDAVRSPTVLAQ